jgi:hypothetical protein
LEKGWICVDNIRTDHVGPFAALNKSKLGAKGGQKGPKLFQKWLVGDPNQPWWSKLAGFGWLKVGYV